MCLDCSAHENEIEKFLCNGQAPLANGVPADGRGRLIKVIENLDYTVHC